MNLTINGESRHFDAQMTLSALIDQMGMKHDRVAVELNRNIIQRDAWPGTHLKDGDNLEIVHFVGGGTENNISPPQSIPQTPKKDTFSNRRSLIPY